MFVSADDAVEENASIGFSVAAEVVERGSMCGKGRSGEGVGEGCGSGERGGVTERDPSLGSSGDGRKLKRAVWRDGQVLHGQTEPSFTCARLQAAIDRSTSGRPLSGQPISGQAVAKHGPGSGQSTSGHMMANHLLSRPTITVETL